MGMQELFESEEYCNSELVGCRKALVDIKTTPEELDALQDGLAFMYLYCPDHIKDIVLATMDEIESRKRFRRAKAFQMLYDIVSI